MIISKIPKILNMLANSVIIIGGITIILGICADMYKNINVTNKIENPSECLEINNEFYCKVETDKKEQEFRIL